MKEIIEKEIASLEKERGLLEKERAEDSSRFNNSLLIKLLKNEGKLEILNKIIKELN